MDIKHVYFCENSLEGILTAVYVAWEAKVGHANVEIRTKSEDNLEFFCVYHEVAADLEKAEKVLRTMRRKLGTEITEDICYAACAEDEEKGTAIYRTLVDCLSVNGASYGKRRLDNLKNPSVWKVVELYKTVWGEYHHYLGFLRFKQITEQILFATITPKHDILLLFQEHSSDRFITEHWIIYDNKRKKALLHMPYGPCTVYAGNEQILEQLSACKDMEQDYERLFQGFCQSIAIKERTNLDLQRQNLPHRFREHMVEFEKHMDVRSEKKAF